VGFVTPTAVDSAKARGVRRLGVRGGREVLLTLAFDSTTPGFLCITSLVWGAKGRRCTA